MSEEEIITPKPEEVTVVMKSLVTKSKNCVVYHLFEYS